MRILFAERVSSGGIWKEVALGLFISFLVHLTGLVLCKALLKYGYLPQADAAEYAALGCVFLAALGFLLLRFSFFASSGIGVGAGLVVMASQQAEFWMSVLVWATGLALIVRGFSEGSRLR